MGQVKRFNRWFDRLQEPTRCSVFVALMLPAWVALILHYPVAAIWWFIVLGVVRKFPWI